MPLYDYKCKKCGVQVELDRIPTDEEVRHITGKGKVCGTFRRVWTSINVNTANLRSARG